MVLVLLVISWTGCTNPGVVKKQLETRRIDELKESLQVECFKGWEYLLTDYHHHGYMSPRIGKDGKFVRCE